jgi:hypothetical protein
MPVAMMNAAKRPVAATTILPLGRKRLRIVLFMFSLALKCGLSTVSLANLP